jgi:hypothetical protein
VGTLLSFSLSRGLLSFPGPGIILFGASSAQVRRKFGATSTTTLMLLTACGGWGKVDFEPVQIRQPSGGGVAIVV